MPTTRKRKLWKLLPIARAIAVLSAVGLITTAVTFAAIQSNGNALTGNVIQTATAALQISTNANSGPWSDSTQGFTFSGLVPGGPAQPSSNGGYSVFLKNTGTAPLRLMLHVPTPPSAPSTVDLSKVSVLLTPYTGGTTQTMLLSDLIAGTVDIANSTIAVSGVGSYRVQVSMASDAVTGNGATISNLDLSFSGTPQ
ncbi:MAG TPA: hypothetical protein VLF69_04205 [Candidatus Saccharimonadales bacterium]|nr:hypothetical protein [Candidatus Saccharimonadales bacterium]